MEFIDLKKQYQLIKSDVNQRINKVLASGAYILGAEVLELETMLASYVGVKHCIGVADGTLALQVALMALEIGIGDEVIIPAFTFFSTAEVVALVGAVPVMVDIKLEDYNMDCSKIEAAVTSKTKAIIPVSLYGQCAQLEKINQLAKSYNLAVIEDGAQSFGAKLKNNYSCAMTTVGCTSFFPSKPLGCYGDGGACFTNDDDLALKIRQIRIHGQNKRYQHLIIGMNGRLDTIQAAILLAKMAVFPQEIILRQQIANRYNQLLKDCSCVTPDSDPHNLHVYGQYTILVEQREQFAQFLAQAGIPTVIHYPIPLHKQVALKKYPQNQDLTVAEYCAEHVISLPMHPYLNENDQDFIVENIIKFLDNHHVKYS